MLSLCLTSAYHASKDASALHAKMSPVSCMILSTSTWQDPGGIVQPFERQQGGSRWAGTQRRGHDSARSNWTQILFIPYSQVRHTIDFGSVADCNALGRENYYNSPPLTQYPQLPIRHVERGSVLRRLDDQKKLLFSLAKRIPSGLENATSWISWSSRHGQHRG
jgi:hypothetical protein